MSSKSENRAHHRHINQWLESQRGRPQYRPMPHARKAVARIMKPLSKKYGYGHTGLASHWKDIVGDKLSHLSKPLKFQGAQGQRSLLISAPGPAASLIMASNQRIIDQVNNFMGANYVSKIKIVQSRLKPTLPAQPKSSGLSPHMQNRLETGLENVKNDPLKQALNTLGYHAFTQQDS